MSPPTITSSFGVAVGYVAKLSQTESRDESLQFPIRTHMTVDSDAMILQGVVNRNTIVRM